MYWVKGSTTSKPTQGKKILVIYSSIVICLPHIASVLLATSSSLCSHWHLMSNPPCCITQHGEELFGSNAELTATARDGIAMVNCQYSISCFVQRGLFFGPRIANNKLFISLYDHSDHMSQRSQVSRVTLSLCFLKGR